MQAFKESFKNKWKPMWLQPRAVRKLMEYETIGMIRDQRPRSCEPWSTEHKLGLWMLRNVITKFSVMQTQSKERYLIPEYFQNNLNGGGGFFVNLLQNKNSVIRPDSSYFRLWDYMVFIRTTQLCAGTANAAMNNV